MIDLVKYELAEEVFTYTDLVDLLPDLQVAEFSLGLQCLLGDHLFFLLALND